MFIWQSSILTPIIILHKGISYPYMGGEPLRYELTHGLNPLTILQIKKYGISCY